MSSGVEVEGDGAEEERGNLYQAVFEFVGDFLTRVCVTDISQQRGDLHWCQYAEAVARLKACWRAFEVLRLAPGTGDWYDTQPL